ncbi:hypothetical protein PILCRDRAFT_192356 [Piloderma croceum F 1598]|uniref:MARVEL domain-containing protein n=1 Tax=Piloderma croceum (strain F 1598) TaxID=765440 RepID=A0A0C3CIZ0_PILCF|nr:hypothetical protein PILCRDRAFT_192356 [Piloderma croceum F 1598]
MALHALRIILYVLLFLFSIVLFGLCAARLHYTTHLPPNDPLNGGTSFYDPIVAELLVTSLFTMLWSPTIAHAVHTKYEYRRRYLSSFLFELAGLGLFFVFWIVGAGVATSLWGNLRFCHQYQACRILTTLVAFAWMGFIMIFILLVVSTLFAISNNAFHEPLHGRWDPRESHYHDNNPEMRRSVA